MGRTSTRAIKVLFINILVTVALCIAVEAILWALEYKTGDGAYSVLERLPRREELADKPYPKNPSDYLKIAVFGGSTAAGYNAERPFSAILEHALIRESSAPRKIYVRNYAGHGYPFVGHQAVWARQALGRYDIIIIYAGGVDSSGRGVSDVKTTLLENDDAVKTLNRTRIVDFLSHRSRAYALMVRYRRKNALHNATAEPVNARNDKDMGAPSTLDSAKLSRVENSHKLSLPQRQAIARRFVHELKDLVVASQATKTRIIVPTEVSHQLFPPVCSAWSTKEGPAHTQVATSLLEQASELYRKGRYAEALGVIDKVSALDSTLAEVNYLRGRALLAQGRYSQAWGYLQTAADNDCSPTRTHSAIYNGILSLAGTYPQLVVVDLRPQFQKLFLLERADDLFSDIVHLSLAGHYLVAQAISAALNERGLLTLKHQPTVPNDWDMMKQGLDLMAKELRITSYDTLSTDFYVGRWNISLALRTSKPQKFLELGLQRLIRVRSVQTESNDYLLPSTALIAVAQAMEGDQSGALQSLNYYRGEKKLLPALLSYLKHESGSNLDLSAYLQTKGIIYEEARQRFSQAKTGRI
jgi:tetratricopeptide (TPR) repeat protein